MRRADLLDAAAIHDHHAVGDLQRLLLVVRDEHRRHVDLVVQVAQPAPQLLADLGIERAERLVEQQDARLDGERAGKRHALALAAGKLARIAVGQPLELDQIEQLLNARVDFRLGDALPALAHAQAEGDVLEHAHMPEQRIMLEHEADVALADAARQRVLSVEMRPDPRSGHSRPAMMRSSVVLPEPEGPSSATSSPESTVEVDAGKRREGAEALGDIEELDLHGRPHSEWAYRSSTAFAIKVTSASSASSDATANAAMNWYSL